MRSRRPGSADLAALAARARRRAHAGRRRPHASCSSASEPDVVLNAVVGFAGVGATLWALERGITLALANKESLVAAGALALEAREREEACCCRSTPSIRLSSSAWKGARRSLSTRSC